MILPGSAARLVLERLRAGAVAARPPIRYDSDAASWLVRSYYRARSRVPAVLGSLWGAGVYGLSAVGRRRFGAFPDLVADDLWVDGHFTDGEIEIVDCPPVVVVAPRRTRDLVEVLRRVYVGKGRGRPRPIRTAGRPRRSHRPCATSAGSPLQVRLRRSTPRPTPLLPPARGSRFRLAPSPAMGGGGTRVRGQAEMGRLSFHAVPVTPRVRGEPISSTRAMLPAGG